MKYRTINKVFTAVVLSVILSLGIVIVPDNISPAVTVEAAVTKLSTPTGIKSTVTENSITITWNKVSGASSYRVYRYNSKSKKWGKFKDVKGTSVTITDLKADTTYHFKIAAVKGSKTGNKSSEITATTKKKANSLPSAPKEGYTGLASYNGAKYYFKDGKIASGLITIDNGTMYFDTTTYQMKTGWQKLADGETYYFNSNGYMLKNGTFIIDHKNCTFDKSGKNTGIELSLPNPSKYGGWTIISSDKKSYSALKRYYDDDDWIRYSEGIKDMYRNALKEYGYELVFEEKSDQYVSNTYGILTTYSLTYNGKVCGTYQEFMTLGLGSGNTIDEIIFVSIS